MIVQHAMQFVQGALQGAVYTLAGLVITAMATLAYAIRLDKRNEGGSR